MHHGRDEAMRDRLTSTADKLTAEHQLGATGQYPQGKLTPADEGELKIAIGVEDGKVVVAFGKPTAWIGMDARQARQLAESIRQASHRC